MKKMSNFIPVVIVIQISSLIVVFAEDSTPPKPSPPSGSQQVQMHDVPAVSGNLRGESDYSFEERSDDFRLRENAFDSPAPIDPTLFTQPNRPARKPERKKNWLTPKSNMDRIQGREERSDLDQDDEDSESDRPSQGWLVDDVISRQQERTQSNEEEDTENDSDGEDLFSGSEKGERGDREAEESDSAFGVFQPTANFIDDERPGQVEEEAERYAPLVEDTSAQTELESERIYDRPIQWGGVQAADSPSGLEGESSEFMASENFTPTTTGLGAMDQLNKSIQQNLMQPRSTFTSSVGSGSLDPSPRASFGTTTSIRSSQLSAQGFSGGGLSAGGRGSRTTSSAGFSGWSPAGPQEPAQAFEPLSSR